MKMILLILTSFCFFSCSQEKDTAPVTELPFFFIGVVNGQPVGFAQGSTQGNSYVNQVYESVEQPSADSFHVYEGTTIFEEFTFPAGSATVSLMAIFNHQPTPDEKVAMFSTGFRPYALSDSTGQGGAKVNFVDGKGVSWSTLNHAQSDTSFRIEVITPITDPEAKATFQASFSCKLFNAAGDSMNLENGSVRGKILKP